jgi:hypothetical protein
MGIELVGGPLDGALVSPEDNQPPAKAGAIINFPSDQPDGMVHLYEVRKSDPTKADYLDEGYYGPHQAD